MKKIYALLTASVVALSAFAGSYDLELSSINVKSSSVINKDVVISGVVTNVGSETIHSFTLNWNDGNADHETVISGLHIVSGESYSFTHPVNFIPSEARKYNLIVEVKNPDGNIDVTVDNNALSKGVHGTSREAVKKVVAEEATGTWCGFCPRGAVFMDLAAEEFGDSFIGIAVHDGDPMTVTSYDNDIADFITGYPTVLLDKETKADPSLILTKIPSRLDDDPVADINVHGNYDDAEGKLYVTVTAKFLSADDGIDYRFNVVLTEDDVTGTASGYAQTNYYSIAAYGGVYGDLYGWEDLPSPVPAADMVYEYVARATAEDWFGTEGSVPSVITDGLYITYDYEFDIDEDWDVNNMHVIAMLLDFDANDSGSSDDEVEVLNANTARLTELTVSADAMANAYDIDVYPNPATVSTNIRIDLSAAAELSMYVTDLSGNIVAQKNYGMQSGNIALPVNTVNFASGMYLINVVAGGEKITQKLNVIH